MRDEPIPASGVESFRVAGLDDLLGLFPETRRMLRGVRGIPAPAVPSPYHELLVHEEHMTVTLERFHGAPVDLEVFEVRRDGDDYARRLILRVGAQGPVVLAPLEWSMSWVSDGLLAMPRRIERTSGLCEALSGR